MTTTVTTIGANLNAFLAAFWPYVLTTMVGVLLILLAASVAIGAVLSLAGRRGGGVSLAATPRADARAANIRYENSHDGLTREEVSRDWSLG